MVYRGNGSSRAAHWSRRATESASWRRGRGGRTGSFVAGAGGGGAGAGAGVAAVLEVGAVGAGVGALGDAGLGAPAAFAARCRARLDGLERVTSVNGRGWGREGE